MVLIANKVPDAKSQVQIQLSGHGTVFDAVDYEDGALYLVVLLLVVTFQFLCLNALLS
jgi:hypothetical protein